MVVSWAAPAGRGFRLAVVTFAVSPSGSRGAAATTVAVSPARRVELSFLVANSDQAVKPAEALIAAFEKKNPNINIKLETGPQGTELDNMVKTRLATAGDERRVRLQHRARSSRR